MLAMDLFVLLAHVKWFTQALPGVPQPALEVITPPFLLAWMLTLGVMLFLTRLNQPLQALPWVQRIHASLERLYPWTAWMLRIGLAVPLLAAAYGGYLFHYELGPVPLWIRVLQAVLGLVILIPGADRYAAMGTIGLYLVGTVTFGFHPLIDYLSWLGAAYYLAARGTRAAGASIAILSITTGLSLSWAAVEKWVYPHMALDILQHAQIPTFGFPPHLFLMLAGWVELGVGYLLITGVLNRFLSVVVTGLFVLTSSLFGFKELLGHWQLHAILLVFLAEGTGPYITPVLWHRSKGLQLSFVGVTLIPFVTGLLWLYYRWS
jgi:uncharacterized membrane protein YphA (DoxX/SURF4 family)